MSEVKCDICQDTGAYECVLIHPTGKRETFENICTQCCEHEYDSSEGMMCINCGEEYPY